MGQARLSRTVPALVSPWGVVDASNVENEAELMSGRPGWPESPVVRRNGPEGEIKRCYGRCHSRVTIKDGCKCLTLEREARLLKIYTCELCIVVYLNDIGDYARAVLLAIPCFEAWRRATRERARVGESAREGGGEEEGGEANTELHAISAKWMAKPKPLWSRKKLHQGISEVAVEQWENKSRKDRLRTPANVKFQGECHYCGKKGHKQTDCRLKARDEAGGGGGGGGGGKGRGKGCKGKGKRQASGAYADGGGGGGKANGKSYQRKTYRPCTYCKKTNHPVEKCFFNPQPARGTWRTRG